MTTQMTTQAANITKKQNTVADLILREYEGFAFMFDSEGRFNMTRAAAHFGKRLDNFLRSERTQDYISKLEQELSSFTKKQGMKVVTTVRGRPDQGGGTWAHKDFAVFFARWISVDFERWCDAIIQDIVAGNAELTITKPEQSVVVRLPTNAEMAFELYKSFKKQEEMEDKIKELETTIDEQQDDVVFVQKYVEADGLHTFREVAKMLNVKEHTLREMMVEQGIQYKVNKIWMPKQIHIDSGYFVIKAYIDPHGQSFPSVYYTPRGVTWIGKRLNKWLSED